MRHIQIKNQSASIDDAQDTPHYEIMWGHSDTPTILKNIVTFKGIIYSLFGFINSTGELNLTVTRLFNIEKLTPFYIIETFTHKRRISALTLFPHPNLCALSHGRSAPIIKILPAAYNHLFVVFDLANSQAAIHLYKMTEEFPTRLILIARLPEKEYKIPPAPEELNLLPEAGEEAIKQLIVASDSTQQLVALAIQEQTFMPIDKVDLDMVEKLTLSADGMHLKCDGQNIAQICLQDEEEAKRFLHKQEGVTLPSYDPMAFIMPRFKESGARSSSPRGFLSLTSPEIKRIAQPDQKNINRLRNSHRHSICYASTKSLAPNNPGNDFGFLSRRHSAPFGFGYSEFLFPLPTPPDQPQLFIDIIEQKAKQYVLRKLELIPNSHTQYKILQQKNLDAHFLPLIHCDFYGQLLLASKDADQKPHLFRIDENLNPHSMDLPTHADKSKTIALGEITSLLPVPEEFSKAKNYRFLLVGFNNGYLGTVRFIYSDERGWHINGSIFGPFIAAPVSLSATVGPNAGKHFSINNLHDQSIAFENKIIRLLNAKLLP